MGWWSPLLIARTSSAVPATPPLLHKSPSSLHSSARLPTQLLTRRHPLQDQLLPLLRTRLTRPLSPQPYPQPLCLHHPQLLFLLQLQPHARLYLKQQPPQHLRRRAQVEYQPLCLRLPQQLSSSALQLTRLCRARALWSSPCCGAFQSPCITFPGFQPGCKEEGASNLSKPFLAKPLRPRPLT